MLQWWVSQEKLKTSDNRLKLSIKHKVLCLHIYMDAFTSACMSFSMCTTVYLRWCRLYSFTNI